MVKLNVSKDVSGSTGALIGPCMTKGGTWYRGSFKSLNLTRTVDPE